MENHKLGKRIKIARKKAGLNQYQLAEAVDVTTSMISAIERGVRTPSLELLINIVNALDTTADLVLRDLLKNSYKVQANKLSDMVEALSPAERQRVFNVVETMIKSS